MYCFWGFELFLDLKEDESRIFDINPRESEPSNFIGYRLAEMHFSLFLGVLNNQVSIV